MCLLLKRIFGFVLNIRRQRCIDHEVNPIPICMVWYPLIRGNRSQSAQRTTGTKAFFVPVVVLGEPRRLRRGLVTLCRIQHHRKS